MLPEVDNDHLDLESHQPGRSGYPAAVPEVQASVSPDPIASRVESARERLLQSLREGLAGGPACAAYAHELLALLEEQAIRVDQELDKNCVRPVALLALGGLGRESHAPYSDIDLMLLVRELDEECEAFVSALVRPLWDAGLRVNCAQNTPDAWLRSAEEDLPLCTSLLDARCLWGKAAVVEKLHKSAQDRFFGEGRSVFLDRLVAEQRERHDRYGATVYRVQPDLKFGPGGTRDLAILEWACMATHGTRNLRELRRRRVVRRRAAATLIDSRDEILRIRAVLQLAAARGQDRLVHLYQEEVPRLLGRLGPREEASEEQVVEEIERLMRDYHRAARDLLRFGERIFARCYPPRTEADSGPKFVRLDERFSIKHGQLAHESGTDPFARTPVLALEALVLAREHQVRLSARTGDAIADAVSGEGGARLAFEPQAQRLFFDVLSDPRERRGTSTLGLAMDLGLLGRLVPEFAPSRGRMQHEGLHIYTVDQHSVYAVEWLKSVARGEQRKAFPLASALHLQLDDPRALYLATLLHDSGKAYGDQLGVGASIAETAAKRGGLGDDDVTRVATLVREHMTLPMTSQERDISDPLLLEELAERLDDPRLLRELYLLSLADMANVAPDYLSGWKLALLDELYLALAFELAQRKGGSRAVLSQDRPAGPAGMPPRYYTLYDAEIRALHLELVEKARGEDDHIWVDWAEGPGAWRLTLVAPDREGLLARVAGVVEGWGLSVEAADIFSAPGEPPLALDVFRVSRPDVERGSPGGVLDPAAREGFERELRASILGPLPQEAPGPRPRLGPRRSRRREVRVYFDADPAGERTILTVEAPAHQGSLHRVSLALAHEKIDIELARVGGGEGTRDVFYVRRLDPTEQELLRERLRSYLRHRS